MNLIKRYISHIRNTQNGDILINKQTKKKYLCHSISLCSNQFYYNGLCYYDRHNIVQCPTNGKNIWIISLTCNMPNIMNTMGCKKDLFIYTKFKNRRKS